MKKFFSNLKTKNNNKGFTLIELLIFIGIFSILITSLFQLLIAVFDVQLESQSTSVISQDGRYILNKLTNDIKNATSVTTPAVKGIAGQGSTMVISDGTVTYTYTLTNGNLTLNNSVLGTTDQLNSVNTYISNLNFIRLSDVSGNFNTITVSFVLNSVGIKRSGEVAKTFDITVGTR